MLIAKEILDMLELGHKSSQVISVVFLDNKIISKIPWDGFRLLLSMVIDVPIA